MSTNNSIDYISEKTRLRNEKTQHSVIDRFPDIREYNERIIWGVFSWKLARVRWLLSRFSVYTESGYYCTLGDVVRDYLDYAYPNKLRATAQEARAYSSFPIYAPLYCRPTVGLDYTYVDIKAAYWSICSLIGWNCKYLPGVYLIPGRPPADFPIPDNKTARNYLVSISLPGGMIIWTGKTFVSQNTRNAHLNMALWSAVQDILHMIAMQALRLGAIYVHTDGYILPTQAAPSLITFLKEIGLDATIKAHGVTILTAIGNYCCGVKRTALFDCSRPPSSYDNIRIQDYTYLYDDIQHIISWRAKQS